MTHDDTTDGRRVAASDNLPSRARARGAQPFGRTAELVERVRATHGDAFVQAWLGRTCQFEDANIWTHDFGRDRLLQVCFQDLRALGVHVVVDDQSRAHFRAVANAMATERAARKPAKRSAGAAR